MTLPTNEPPDHQENTEYLSMNGDIEPKAGRDCVPYNLRDPLEFVLENTRVIGVQIESMGALVLDAVTAGSGLDAIAVRSILAQLAPAVIENSENLSLLNLMLQAGRESSIREYERLMRKRRNANKAALK